MSVDYVQMLWLLSGRRWEKSNAPFYRHPGLDPGSSLILNAGDASKKAGSRIKSGMTEEIEQHPLTTP
ncbi:MAG: hypothetical protein ACT6UL_08900 [Sphingopyxis sp.]